MPATSANLCVDEVRNPVLFQRCEYKYVIPSELMAPIRAYIRPYCDIDPYADRESGKFYTIRTLYLDSPRYKTYWAKEDEVPNRFKLRVRTYGTDSDAPVKFEVKRRLNDVFLKSSVVVPGDSWPRLLTAPVNGFRPNFSRVEKAPLAILK